MNNKRKLLVPERLGIETIFGCNECGYTWENDPDSFCPCCDNSNIHESGNKLLLQ